MSDTIDRLVVKPSEGEPQEVAKRIIMRGHERGYLTSHSMHEMVALVDRVFTPEAPSVEPWTRETCPLGIEVKHKRLAFRALITSSGIDVGAGGKFYTYREMLGQFEQLDGSACGAVKANESAGAV